MGLFEELHALADIEARLGRDKALSIQAFARSLAAEDMLSQSVEDYQAEDMHPNDPDEEGVLQDCGD